MKRQHVLSVTEFEGFVIVSSAVMSFFRILKHIQWSTTIYTIGHIYGCPKFSKIFKILWAYILSGIYTVARKFRKIKKNYDGFPYNINFIYIRQSNFSKIFKILRAYILSGIYTVFDFWNKNSSFTGIYTSIYGSRPLYSWINTLIISILSGHQTRVMKISIQKPSHTSADYLDV